MKKLFAFSLLMAVPATASVVIKSPVVVNTGLASGGKARCINPNGCRSWAAPYGQTVAAPGEVVQGVIKDGVDAQGVPFIVVFPLGTTNSGADAIYTRADDWAAA